MVGADDIDESCAQCLAQSFAVGGALYGWIALDACAIGGIVGISVVEVGKAYLSSNLLVGNVAGCE